MKAVSGDPVSPLLFGGVMVVVRGEGGVKSGKRLPAPTLATARQDFRVGQLMCARGRETDGVIDYTIDPRACNHRADSGAETILDGKKGDKDGGNNGENCRTHDSASRSGIRRILSLASVSSRAVRCHQRSTVTSHLADSGGQRSI